MLAGERLTGVQTPRIRLAPQRQGSAAVECVELARAAGLGLDFWQQLALQDALGEVGARWASFEIGLVAPRQNGKGGILEARQLGGLFLFGERLQVHTAHQFRTTQEHFRRIRELVDGSDELRRHVDRIRTADGEEAIELKSRQRLRFVARSGASGRGFSGDVVYLDEAMILDDDAIGALMPTMSARPNPQLWYAGSSGDQRSVVLGRLRRRALAALQDAEREPRLTYLEWSAPDETTPAEHMSRRLWAVANPALGVRISEQFVLTEMAAMDPAMFARERLGVGDWPSDGRDGWLVIPEAAWEARAGAAGRPEGLVAFGVDAEWPDAEAAAVGVAGGLGGEMAVQVVDFRPGTSWVAARCEELDESWDSVGFFVDPGGPAKILIPELRAHGVTVVEMSMRDVAAGFGHVHAGVLGDAPDLRHYGQVTLDRAVAAAQRRPLGDGWTWARKGSVGIAPLTAVTAAVHGWKTFGADDTQPGVWSA